MTHLPLAKIATKAELLTAVHQFKDEVKKDIPQPAQRRLVFEMLEFPTAEQYEENRMILAHKVTWVRLLMIAMRFNCFKALARNPRTILSKSIKRLHVLMDHDVVTVDIYLNCLLVIFTSGIKRKRMYPTVLTLLHQEGDGEIVTPVYAIESLVQRNRTLATLNQKLVGHNILAP